MQRAVQLVGPGRLRLNEQKEVVAPAAHQLLGRVEAVGLCFSDVKLLKQFDQHPRKSEVTSGIAAESLSEMPNYVPDEAPSVPGHEAVIRVVAVGPGVTVHAVGERLLVQTDYRWLTTARSNAAFGYNFEGALQEYVLLDERVFVSPAGESLLIPAPDELSAAAIALCEPWACVEEAYAEPQRRTLLDGGRLLVVGDEPVDPARISGLPGSPAEVGYAAADALESLPPGTYDDVVYFGSDPATVERLFARVSNGGLLNLVLCGGSFGRDVVTEIGRIHYGGIRLTGTSGSDPAEALEAIPATPEIRPGDTIDVIGAAGPMGTMHVIRSLSHGVPGVTVLAGDLAAARLDTLRELAEPLAHAQGLAFHAYNPSSERPPGERNYIVLAVPAPALVAQAVRDAAPGAIINVFAGIPAVETGEIDLDAYVTKGCYFVGTSGSELEDMKAVLARVAAGRLDTNLSVGAVAGLDGAIDGISALERNTVPGKIVVYPSCVDLPLTLISEIGEDRWNRETEEALLSRFGTT
jgi:L-sorbose 1-phosphate reductase